MAIQSYIVGFYYDFWLKILSSINNLCPQIFNIINTYRCKLLRFVDTAYDRASVGKVSKAADSFRHGRGVTHVG